MERSTGLVLFGLLKNSEDQFFISLLIFFLALPQKETKKSSPFKPINPRKPKFPANAQGRESPPFWLPSIRRPGKRTGHRAV